MKETLHEQIRNKLSPMVNLIAVVENMLLNENIIEDDSENFKYMKFLKLSIDKCKDNINDILRLTEKL